MNHLTLYSLFVGLLLFWSCKENKVNNTAVEQSYGKPSGERTDKIQVLNFGTFHMGFTPDANTTEFDEHDKENQRKVHEIAMRLSAFKPTVIIVEKIPEHNEQLQTEYNSYLGNPDMLFRHPSEIQLLAYEVGRLSGTKRIYGIDHHMEYNYTIGEEIKNSIDSLWYNQYYKNPLRYYPEVNVDEDTMNLVEKLRLTNNEIYLDFLIAANADMLTHAGTDNNFEGADEAAKYYQRNLRMYSNLNRIDLNEKDRVFILMGAAHTAFFRDFISRSPKYTMVDSFDYLK
jgi:hypothetical protein